MNLEREIQRLLAPDPDMDARIGKRRARRMDEIDRCLKASAKLIQDAMKSVPKPRESRVDRRKKMRESNKRHYRLIRKLDRLIEALSKKRGNRRLSQT